MGGLLACVLSYLGRHGVRVLFAGVFIGLLLPDLAALCRPLLAPTVALLLLAAALRLDLLAAARQLRRPLLLLALLVWLQLVSAVLLWAGLGLLALPSGLETALVLMAAAPPILGAAPIAVLLGLDGALALVVILGATLLAPITAPPLALALLDLELSIGIGEFTGRLALVVGCAAAGTALIRGLAPRGWLEGQAERIDGLVVVLMLIFAVAIMDGVTSTLLERPATVALWIAAAFVANPLLQLLGWAAFRPLGLSPALTLGLLSGNRNMGLMLAALPAGTAPEVALFFALAQLPMYMLPALLLPFYRRLLRAAPPPRP